MTTARLLRALLVCLAAAVALPGCVAWEIRDEMRRTNDSLATLRTDLEKLEKTNAMLDDVSAQLKDLRERQLSQVAVTNERLTELHARLETLKSIEVSLRSLDEQLVAVRSLVESVGGVMSWFGSKKKEEEEVAARTAARAAAWDAHRQRELSTTGVDPGPTPPEGWEPAEPDPVDPATSQPAPDAPPSGAPPEGKAEPDR